MKESGKVFAVPTYFFMINMVLLLGSGRDPAVRRPLHQIHQAHGMITFGKQLDGPLFMGASLYVVMHAFASGGAAVTGVEAISNGVPVFRKPAWKNARTTLVDHGHVARSHVPRGFDPCRDLHATPYGIGTPTVISQVGKFVYGPSTLGRILFYGLQAGTMLILVLAANTSFADFPRLASFHAGDNFMPRQLTKRGHRLVFSNGIIFLAIAGIVLLIATDAKVDRLIPLYAIGVFTSFTLSQAGMAKHHIREKEEGWRWGLFVNGTGAVMSGVVDIIIGVTKFKHGAWVIVVFVPIMVMFLVRLAKQYEREDEALVREVPQAVAAPVRRRLVVMVFVDRLDLAVAARHAVRHALRPDELHRGALRDRPAPRRRARRPVARARPGEHGPRAHRLPRPAAHALRGGDRGARAEQWRRRGVRAAPRAHVQRRVAPDPPRPDRGGDGPRDPASPPRQRHHRAVPLRRPGRDGRGAGPTLDLTSSNGHTNGNGNAGNGNGKAPRSTIVLGGGGALDTACRADGTTPIGSVRWREQVCIHGRVQALRVEPLAGSPSMECTVEDDTGGVTVVFFGRRHIDGIEIGSALTATGMAIEHRGRLAIVNPVYELEVGQRSRRMCNCSHGTRQRVPCVSPEGEVHEAGGSRRARADQRMRRARARPMKCSGRQRAAGGPTN